MMLMCLKYLTSRMLDEPSKILIYFKDIKMYVKVFLYKNLHLVENIIHKILASQQ